MNDAVTEGGISMEGITVFWADKSVALSGNSYGRGESIYINNSWSRNIKEIYSHCYPNFERLSIKCCPFYLPMEFSVLIITAVCILSDAKTKAALNILYSFTN